MSEYMVTVRVVETKVYEIKTSAKNKAQAKSKAHKLYSKVKEPHHKERQVIIEEPNEIIPNYWESCEW